MRYNKLDSMVNNFIVNKKGIYEIITYMNRLKRWKKISNYKIKQVNELCEINIKIRGK